MTTANQAPLPRLSKRRWYVLRLLSGTISSTGLYLFFCFFSSLQRTWPVGWCYQGVWREEIIQGELANPGSHGRVAVKLACVVCVYALTDKCQYAAAVFWWIFCQLGLFGLRFGSLAAWLCVWLLNSYSYGYSIRDILIIRLHVFYYCIYIFCHFLQLLWTAGSAVLC